MNVSETLQIIAALKDCGASHFKSNDFEIRLNSTSSHELLPPPALQPEPAQVQVPVQVQENKEATEKLKNLINTLSLPPEQLADVIFPAGAGG